MKSISCYIDTSFFLFIGIAKDETEILAFDAKVNIVLGWSIGAIVVTYQTSYNTDGVLSIDISGKR